MKAAALASGSSGNCFYVGDSENALLIDAGISAKKVFERLHSLNLNPSKIRGIFVTHEHGDHIRGVDVLSRELNIPIFATNGTIKNGFLSSNEKLIHPIKNNETIKLKGFEIETFIKSHKAAEPVFYSVSNKKGKKVSVITDLGCTSKKVNEEIAESNSLFLESNHDVWMVENGPYPYFLKKWILSNDGHLSNMQAALAVLEHGSSKLKNVVLSHLSMTNNKPEMALRTFNDLLRERHNFNANVSLSSRDSPTKVFRL